jgi:hypothetical protein
MFFLLLISPQPGAVTPAEVYLSDWRYLALSLCLL